MSGRRNKVIGCANAARLHWRFIVLAVHRYLGIGIEGHGYRKLRAYSLRGSRRSLHRFRVELEIAGIVGPNDRLQRFWFLRGLDEAKDSVCRSRTSKCPDDVIIRL